MCKVLKILKISRLMPNRCLIIGAVIIIEVNINIDFIVPRKIKYITLL